ncbi:4-hydroxyphenylpyruvate dioxygenase family protein [Cupriavidus basilensis]
MTEFARVAIGAGYRESLSLEIFNDEFRAAPARLTAQDGLRSLIWLESEAGALPRHGRAAFRRRRLPGVRGGLRSRTGTGMRLRSLGFSHAGRHRSKAVYLYRQGGVNIILNAEQDSAAAEHFQLHGPSVCALGLKAADDAQRALSRARVPCCARNGASASARTNAAFPAVRARDGMLFYSIDEKDSTAASTRATSCWNPAAPTTRALGLTAIDHIAQALPPHRLDSFVLFYKTVFGPQAEALHEIADPYGLVKSRAMVSPEQNIRIPLNVSESSRTATGRFVTAYAGSGIHHIAFRTPGLSATLERIVPAEAAMLHVPDNYYDDVGARLGLDDALLERLRRQQLLYDRDAGGEFPHAYTEPFHDRFFFELVQRDVG